MKNVKNIVKIITIMICLLPFLGVKAFPDSITIKEPRTNLGLDSNYNVVERNGDNIVGSLPYFNEKNSDNGKVICISGIRKDTPSAGTIFKKDTTFPSKDSIAMAYIINLIESQSANDISKYYWKEMLSFGYFGKFDVQYPGINGSNPKTILGTGKTLAEIVAAANTYATSGYTAKISVDKESLTFTKGTDGYYYSDYVTVTTSNSWNIKNPTNSKFEVEKNGNKFRLKIQDSKIQIGTSESVQITVEATNNYKVSQKYICDSSKSECSGLQDIMITTLESKTSTASATVTGNIVKDTETVISKKSAVDSKELPGATLTILNSNNQNISCTVLLENGTKNVLDKCTWVSTDKPTKIVGLPIGSYKLKETIAPRGFELNTTVVDFQVKGDGKATQVEMVNNKKQINIEVNKVDGFNNRLTGVKMMLQTEAQRSLKQEGIIKVSSTSNIVFENLNPGTYYLTEIEYLKGYNTNLKPIQIDIDIDGNISVNGKKQEGNVIKVVNTLTETVISKVSAVDSKELPGATLTVLDEKEKDISCTILLENGTKKVLDKCTWVSNDKPTKIVGLEAGVYNLKETIAPKGYQLNTSMAEFEVKADGSINRVEMINELEVEVPDTLSSRSALLLTIGMFDIALGIGIITYVKKNKIEE